MGSEDVSFSAPSSEKSNPKKRAYSYGDTKETPITKETPVTKEIFVSKEKPFAKGNSLGLTNNDTYVFGCGIDPGRPFTFLPKDRL